MVSALSDRPLEEQVCIRSEGKFLSNLSNYGPTLGTTKDANSRGHQQVLWLYEDKKIIEVGASNVFFVFKSKNGKRAEIVTPDLEDLILPGVTRDSIIVNLQLL